MDARECMNTLEEYGRFVLKTLKLLFKTFHLAHAHTYTHAN